MEPFAIASLSAGDAERHRAALSELLHACVAAGASVNFVLPWSLADSETYWTGTVLPKLRGGTALLLVARSGDRIVGSVRLDLVALPNQPHRAEVSKLLVHPAWRRRGIGRALMLELERLAYGHGRMLLTLDTRTGDAAQPLYEALGYVPVGEIPGYSLDPAGSGRLDATTILYKQLTQETHASLTDRSMKPGDFAIILCSHGVNGVPGAASAHAARLHERGLYESVTAACISGEPEILAAVDAATAAGIVVVPFLMAAGRAYNTLLPERLAQSGRREIVQLASPVGTHPDIAGLIASKAASLAAERGWAPADVLLVIAAHGTARDPESGVAARAHAAQIAREGRFAGVEAGYLDEPPSLEGLLAGRATRHAIGVGLFADAGPHGAGDAEQPFRADPDTEYAGPVGPDPALAEIVLKCADRAISAISSTD